MFGLRKTSQTPQNEKGEIRIAIAGVGNCASALIQGLFYYRDAERNGGAHGLMYPAVCGYKVSDIKPVAAFDIDARKVGKDLSEAIFAKPNCTARYCNVPYLGVKVEMAQVFDGVSRHMLNFSKKERSFVLADEKPVDVVDVLKKTRADVLINFLPVGSEEASRYYAECALRAGVAFINCIPVFIASDKTWARKFEERKLPLIGDDVKSQIGATILHRNLVKLLVDRGVKIDRTYQLNFGGNTDFLNMLAKERLASKKISKTEAVQSQLNETLSDEDVHIGPSDYVPWLNDSKIAYIRIEGRNFGDNPVEIEVKLSVIDSPNSAGVVIEAIRCAKIAMDRGIGGVLTSASAYFMKHPPIQYRDEEAKVLVEKFIKGEIER